MKKLVNFWLDECHVKRIDEIAANESEIFGDEIPRAAILRKAVLEFITRIDEPSEK